MFVTIDVGGLASTSPRSCLGSENWVWNPRELCVARTVLAWGVFRARAYPGEVPSTWPEALGVRGTFLPDRGPPQSGEPCPASLTRVPSVGDWSLGVNGTHQTG